MKSKNKVFDAGNYVTRLEKQIPGLQDLYRIVALLLAESLPDDGEVLALGAGGGVELKAMRQEGNNWRMMAVDPSVEMIDQAKITLDHQLSNIHFIEGYLDSAPKGPFDGATALLVMHFLDQTLRLTTLKGIHERLKPGAPLVVFHHSFAYSDADKWLNRYADFQISQGAILGRNRSNIVQMKDVLPVLSPSEDESLLYEAGFERVELFHSVLSFKGWIAYA
ncbi:methyltransferase domain-containing protein [Marinomonas posidonica]|uniref:class I SAM-dependent methyltransferase n=1 Tax=Marinomonas posidonica TaxID=936476 RepID=UPI003734F5FE